MNGAKKIRDNFGVIKPILLNLDRVSVIGGKWVIILVYQLVFL